MAASGLSCGTQDLSLQHMISWLRFTGISLAVALGLQNMGSVVVANGLRCPTAYGILIPPPGIKPTSPTWEGGLLNIEPSGKSPKVFMLLSRFSRVWLCATPEKAAHQAPPSLGFTRQEHWSGLPLPSPMHESEKWKEVAQSRPTLSDPMDCSPPGSSVHGIFQARVLEWGAIVGHNCQTLEAIKYFIQ